MLREIEVTPGWYRYKTQTPIRPGLYYQFDARRPDPLTKRRLGLIAASTPSGDFRWLAPHEDWTKWVVQGLFVKETTCYGKSEEDSFARGVLGETWTRLRPYQQRFIQDGLECLSRGWSYRRACVVGLGGGKSLIGLGLCAFGERCVVLAPRHIHDTWRNEAAKWGLPCPEISTYESAHKIGGPIDVLILDEVLRAANPDTQRSAATRQLSERASVVVALTGTPTAGRGPLDWRWLDCVRPGCVPTEETPWRFLFSDCTEQKEVAPGRKAFVTPADGWDTARIAAWVAPFVYRVDTSELLAHLPPVQYQVIRVPQPRDWDVVVRGAATERGTMKRVSQARMLSDGFVYDDGGTPVRVNSDKATAIREFVEGLGEPVVVVARWRESIAHLAKELAEFNPAVVASESADVAWQLARFRSGETSVLIISARYGEGIDGLQDRARVLVFMSNGSANDRKQMEGRLFRHGQSRGVVVVDVVSDSTMDERQLQLIREQSDLAESQIDRILAAEFGLEG